MDLLLEMLNSLITAGGLGFINLFILTRLDKINISKENKEDKIIFLLLFSIINYGLFLIILEYLKKHPFVRNIEIPISIILVTIISVILSFTLFSGILTWINKKINNLRNKENLSSFDSRSIKKIAFGFETNKPIFIFTLDNQLIFSGQSGWFSDLDNSDFELITYPFNSKSELDNYDKIIEYITCEEVESEVYINIDKKIKIIIIH
ncbi:hypothetical protein [Enterococcus mundtii]|uniref:Uncharacterized protein n=1 Tax=Enterococcus mundtii TaxID=53346 RepID=A0A2S7RR14_ENTMU|nr:hypothetical protein [Enterococcus mundtii]PQF22077.1 hypothetical protein CUS89_11955 [Enterococcus mundtii]